VSILTQGLRHLKKAFPEIGYVYLILEDLYPLWPCSVENLSEIQETVLKDQINCVSFVTYDFDRSKLEEVQIGNHVLYKTPKAFRYYNQLQPSIWKFNHLLETCEYALRNSIYDCWSFERIVTDDRYITDCPWPNVLNGLLTRGGRVNLNAIKKIKEPEGAKLKRMLIRNYIFQCPRYAFYRLKERIKGSRLLSDGIKSSSD
jgi:hypothetical protein